MMKCLFPNASFWLWVLAFHHFFMPSTTAQSCGFSEGKSLYQLQLAVQQRSDRAFFLNRNERSSNITSISSIRPYDNTPEKRGVFLPRWSAEDLPFFCKIEHDWSKNRVRIPLKFRLGSVDYVDWLEGKSLDKTRY